MVEICSKAFCVHSVGHESSRTPIIALTLSAYGNDGNYLENQAVNRQASVTNFKKSSTMIEDKQISR